MPIFRKRGLPKKTSITCAAFFKARSTRRCRGSRMCWVNNLTSSPPPPPLTLMTDVGIHGYIGIRTASSASPYTASSLGCAWKFGLFFILPLARPLGRAPISHHSFSLSLSPSRASSSLSTFFTRRSSNSQLLVKPYSRHK